MLSSAWIWDGYWIIYCCIYLDVKFITVDNIINQSKNTYRSIPMFNILYVVRVGGFDYYTLTYDEEDPYEEDSLPGLGSGL